MRWWTPPVAAMPTGPACCTGCCMAWIGRPRAGLPRFWEPSRSSPWEPRTTASPRRNLPRDCGKALADRELRYTCGPGGRTRRDTTPDRSGMSHMANNYLFTSESVSEGHPDKVADQISDAVLDSILREDPRGRVACETLIKTGVVVVAGEVTTKAWVDVEALVRKTVLDIGYNSSDMGFDGASCGVVNIIGKQSPDIAQGVDRKDERKQGAGDQGLMFGYATNETDALMPAAITLAHRLVKKQADVRKKGKLPWLRPDAKSQVTLRYEDDRPVGLEAVVLSTQHSPDVSTKALRESVIEEILKPVLPAKWVDKS